MDSRAVRGWGFSPSKERVFCTFFPAASGNSSSRLTTFGAGVGWGGEVALLLALDASCVRMTSFKQGIKLGTETDSWEATALGSFFHSLFRGCFSVVSLGGN